MPVPTIHTIRTTCGRGRVSFHPEWSASMPWASYWRGTAGRHFAWLDQANQYFKDAHGTRLDPLQLPKAVTP